MKIRLIAIAVIALSPAVVLGQTRAHIRVSKDGTHSTTTSATNGDVYTAPTPARAPAPAAEAAPAPAPAPAPATNSSTTMKTDSSQYGTGAAAPTPTHSQQTDSTMTPMSSDSTSSMNMSTPTQVDTVRVPRSDLNVSPIDSVKMGIPSTRATLRADSVRRTAADSSKSP